MTKVNLTIDGLDIKVDEKTSVLEAARTAGIYVPCLCSHPDLPEAEGMEPASAVYQGDIRIENRFPEKTFEGCMLCLVEVEGEDELVRSCATQVMEGMVVKTDTERVKVERRKKLVPILSGHRHACLTCAQQAGCSMSQCSLNVPQNERCCALFGRCELQAVANFIGILPETPKWMPTDLPVVEEALFVRDYNLCIGCLRCVRACNDLRGVGAIGFVFDEKGQIRVGTLAPTLKDSGCRFCTACVEVCPTGALMDRSVRTEKREEDLLPCRAACPAHIDIPGYIRLVSQGREDEAHAVIREKVPFPGILGRVCPAPCEDVCRRGEVDEPVAVCALKRFAADNEKGLWKKKTIQRDETGKRVAIVGAGPAGLTAAFYLRRLGHAITMFDAHDRPGGMMRYGIPRFRLPRDLLEREINEIMVGIDFRAGAVLGKDFSLEDLKGEGFDALFLAVGAQLSRHIAFEGSDHKDILFGVDFLKRVSTGSISELKDSVIVIGGGNVAVDVARTAVRTGAERVTMVCVEKRDKMPAGRREIESALDEGIDIMNRRGPKSVVTADGKIAGLTLSRCVSVFDEKGVFNPLLGDVAETTCGERIIIAAGQVPDLLFIGKACPVEVREGLVVCDEKTLETCLKGVFAGGDLACAQGSVIHAVSAGRLAAESIDRALGGEGALEEVLFDRDVPEPYIGKIEGFGSLPRIKVPTIKPEKRHCCFDEVCLGLKREQAIREAKRCLGCDLRLNMDRVPFPPEKVMPFTKENMKICPEGEGVYRLYSEKREVIAIKGVASIRKGLFEELEGNADIAFFDFEENRMYSKRESELIGRYLRKHGRMPGGDSDLDELF